MKPHLLRGLTVLFTVLFTALGLAASCLAGPMERADVPAPLKPWVPWALHGSEESPCPMLTGGETRACAWPGRLDLELNAAGGRFSQALRVYGEPRLPVWVALPGSATRWPQEVQADGKAQALVERDGVPGTYLLPGEHKLGGRFAWSSLPENLNVPRSTGMIALTVAGKAVEDPRWDENGLLTLASAERETKAAESVELRIHRLINDDIPLTMLTRVTLMVAGKNREINIAGLLPPDALPLSLASPLPARLDADKKLIVQVRPGQWELNLSARLPGPVKSLKAPAVGGVSEEVWAFSARPALRQVTLEGAPQIDPQQTSLPQEWRRFPAYRIKPGEALNFSETRRGDASPNPDQLTLTRNIWLDFSGAGYTVRDDIAGSLSQSWRLSMGPPYALGRVALGGRDQLITTGEDNKAGIEVRVGQASIAAESRLEGNSRQLPAVGWSFDAQRLGANLHLPPGWRLLAVGGVDQAQGAWVSLWSLLDFFLVLVAAVAAFRLWGLGWGAAMLALLVLTWHEPGAPRWAWIDLVAAVALARALAATRLAPWLAHYRNLAWLVVVVIALPYAVGQVREALYPALEIQYQEVTPGQGANSFNAYESLPAQQSTRTRSRPAAPLPARPDEVAAVAPAPAAPPAVEPENEPAPVVADTMKEERQESAPKPAQAVPEASVLGRVQSKIAANEKAKAPGGAGVGLAARLDDIDPKAVVQTGPGLPRWQWRSYALSWNGPVEKTQTLSLWLLPPWAKGLLVLLQLLLAAAVLARAFDAAKWVNAPLRRFIGGAALLALATLCLPADDARAAPPRAPQAAAASASTEAGGGFPDHALLDELRERLTPPKPECRPNCASLTRMRVENAGNQLRLLLEIHAADQTAVPLPGGPRQWLPTTAMLDGQSTPVLRGDANLVWVAVGPGVHQLVLLGPLPARDAVQLALPLKPKRVEAALSGWQLDGTDADGVPESSLQLSRTALAPGKGEGAAQVEGNIPPFAVVERTLVLGLEWRVLTHVTRATAPGLPLVLELPLLPGENVITPEVKAENGKARVSLAPQATEASFESTLQIRPELKLTAGKGLDWIEIWRLDAGTQWHIDLAGIPMIHRQSGGRYLPQWQPWPGEEVSIKAAKPAAVAGAWLTIDEATLVATPGNRVAEMQLTLSLRASRGGEHVIEFPAGFSLQSALINGRSEPLKLDGGKLKLPISPGAQQITLNMRAAEGISLAYRTPAILLNLPGLNEHVRVELPSDRWLLWFSGPRLGPAILLWGVALVLALVGFALGKTPATPLKSWQWILLQLGLTQTDVLSGAIIVAWLFALAARERLGARLGQGWRFNLMQVALAVLTALALLLLLNAVKSTLLGSPQMQIVGNGSSDFSLHWFQDRGDFPVVALYSLPLLVWRGIMLAWALWLAWSLIAWLRWGWTAYGSGGLWRKGEPRMKKQPKGTAEVAAAPEVAAAADSAEGTTAVPLEGEAPPPAAPPLS